MGIQTKGVHFSYLHAFGLPSGKIRHADLADLQDPDKYLKAVVNNGLENEKLFVRGVGQIRSGMGPRTLRKNTRPLVGDSVLARMKLVYENANTINGRLPYLPYIPIVVDILPSKQRHYKLDFNITPVPPGLARDRCRLSASIHYFPIGCVVSRVGLYMAADDYLDAMDIIPELKFQRQVIVKMTRRGGQAFEGTLPDFQKMIESDFIQGVCGQKEDPATIGSFSFVDFAETDRAPDLTTDRNLIFAAVESSTVRDPNSLKNISYALPSSPEHYEGFIDGLTVFGDRFGFVWTSPYVDEWMRLRYRRHLRNLVSLVLVQLSLNTQLLALDQSGLRDRIRSGTFLRQVEKGLVAPDLYWPLSIRHYLTVQHSFDADAPKEKLFAAIRDSIDTGKVIPSTAMEIDKILDSIAQITKDSGKSVAGLIMNVISDLIGLKP